MKLLGPDHEYVLPPLEANAIVEPTHSVSPVALAVGILLIVAIALFLLVEIHPFKLHSK